MPKVTGPCFSLDASKTLRKTMIYQRKKGLNVVYKYHKPGSREPFTPSFLQLAQRARIAQLVSDWQKLTTDEKDDWDEAAKDVGFVGAGYHYFMYKGGSGLPPAEEEAEVWTVRYEANELPEDATPAWTNIYVPDPLVSSTVEINPAGYLHIIGLNGEQGIWYREPSIDDTVGVTAEIRVKVLVSTLRVTGASPIPFYVYTDNTGVRVDLFTDGVGLYLSGPGVEFYYSTAPIDLTDDYHTIRLTVKDNIAKLYVDGNLLITSDAMVYPGAGWIEFDFGGGLGEDSESYWDYFYYRTDGAFVP